MEAIIRNRITGKTVKVKSTTEHLDSSYGLPVWIDDENNAYFQVGLDNPFYEVVEILKK